MELLIQYHEPALAQTMEDCRRHSRTNFICRDGKDGKWVKVCEECEKEKKLSEDGD